MKTYLFNLELYVSTITCTFLPIENPYQGLKVPDVDVWVALNRSFKFIMGEVL